jgi:micrococcal nuclease
MNRNTKKFLYLLLLALIFGAYYLYSKQPQTPDSGRYTVVNVIDGDTVIIDDAKNSRVRYLGIDTPEIAHQDSPGDPMAQEASEFNSALVEGKEVELEFDQQKYDQYGRILAFVYFDGNLVNEELVKEGLATLVIIEPNHMYSGIMHDALAQAKKNKKGIWGDLKDLNPPDKNRKFRIDLDKANRYEGKRVVVEGEITSSRKSEKVIVLNMEDKLDIVIYPDNWGNFEYFGIDPAVYYRNKMVEATGRVRMRGGKPGIAVDHPMILRSRN